MENPPEKVIEPSQYKDNLKMSRNFRYLSTVYNSDIPILPQDRGFSL
jgi:hypothetical protein